MKPQTSIPTQSLNPNPTISPENKPTLISNPVSDARKTYDLEAEVKNTVESLFKRKAEDFDKLVSYKLISPILFYCDLKRILLLRLVSKGFYHILSPTFLLGLPSPLATAITSFHFDKIYPIIDPSIQEQFNFFQNYAMNCIVKIKDQKELASLQTFLLDPANKKFIDNIEVFDFKELPINTITAGLINTLLLICFSYNGNFIAKLKTIILGDIIESSIFTLPESFNRNTTLRFGNIKEGNALTIYGSAKNLTTFSIGDIETKTMFKLLAQLPNISSLTIGDVKQSTVVLPQALDSLTTLITGSIENSSLSLPVSLNNLITLDMQRISLVKIKLPDVLNNLTNLRIDINSGAIQLPNSLDSLTDLSISLGDDEEILLSDYKAKDKREILNLPNTLNNLKTFSINRTWPLPESLNNLTTFSIEELDSDLKLSSSFHNLKTFHIDYICDHTLEITDELTNLEILNIGAIYAKSTLELSSSLNSLTTLAIEEICGAKIILPELKNLTSLLIGEISNQGGSGRGKEGKWVQAELILPYSLNNLTALMLGSIGYNSIIRLPSMLNNLRICTIKEIGDNVALEFPNTLDQLIFFTLGDMGKNSSLKLPESLDNLISFTKGKMGEGSQIQEPTSWNNLMQENIH